MWHINLNGKLRPAAAEQVFATFSTLISAVSCGTLGGGISKYVSGTKAMSETGRKTGQRIVSATAPPHLLAHILS
jgi:hypothetical protein